MKKVDAKKRIDAGLEALGDAIRSGRSVEFERYLKVMSRFQRPGDAEGH